MTYEPTRLRLWTMPDGYAGAVHPAAYVFLGRNRDSDDLTESNFETGLVLIGGESETVTVIRESHWAFGWVEWIAINPDDDAALRAADRVMERLEGYPVLDEEEWSEREQHTANGIWRDCYNSAERVAYIRRHMSQFEFNGMRDLWACVRGEYFAGYAAELIGWPWHNTVLHS